MAMERTEIAALELPRTAVPIKTQGEDPAVAGPLVAEAGATVSRTSRK
jgi:hypothetical protein